MNQKIKFEVTGDNDLIRRLANMPSVFLLKILPPAIRAGAKPMVRGAKNQVYLGGAQKRTGLLKKSIGVKQYTNRNKGQVVGLVGARYGFRSEVTIPVRRHFRGGRSQIYSRTVMVDPANYSHLVEGGHRIAVGASGRSEKGVALSRTRTFRGGRQKFSEGTANVLEKTTVAPRPFLGPAFRLTKNVVQKEFTKKALDLVEVYENVTLPSPKG